MDPSQPIDSDIVSKLSFERFRKSRKDPEISYLDPLFEDDPVQFLTPKLTPLEHRRQEQALTEQNESKDGVKGATVVVDLNEDLSIDTFKQWVTDLLKSLADVIARSSQKLEAQLKNFQIVAPKDTWAIKINSSGRQKTLFYSEKTRSEIHPNYAHSQLNLQGKIIKVIVNLDGIVIDSKLSQLRPVWSADQILVYEKAAPNPFGTQYSFVDDDSECDSLEE